MSFLKKSGSSSFGSFLHSFSEALTETRRLVVTQIVWMCSDINYRKHL